MSFSISWSRVIPLGGRDDPLNEAGIAFYNRLIDGLLARSMVDGCYNIFRRVEADMRLSSAEIIVVANEANWERVRRAFWAGEVEVWR